MCKQFFPLLTVCHGGNFCPDRLARFASSGLASSCCHMHFSRSLHSGVLSSVLILNLSPPVRPEVHTFLIAICSCPGALSYENFPPLVRALRQVNCILESSQSHKYHNGTDKIAGEHLTVNTNLVLINEVFLLKIISFLIG